MSQVKQKESTMTSTPDERLRGVLYQFVQLHNRWSEDRQAFVAQAEKLEAVLNHLSKAAKTMGEFEPQVGQAVEGALRAATNRVVQVVLNATGDLKDRTDRLNQALGQAQSVLERYTVQTMWSDWKHWITIGLTTLAAAIGVGVWVARLLMPAPTYPLTDDQFSALRDGRVYERVWPKLSAEDQAHWNAVKDKVYKIKPTQP